MTPHPSIDRRSLLVGATAMLGGCVTCRIPRADAAAATVGDAHAHFFNLSDLPVHGFMRHVLAPTYAPNAPEIILALADLAAWVAKTLTVSARAEIRRLGRSVRLGEAKVEADAFARAVADRQMAVINAAAPGALAAADPRVDLAASYLALSRMVGANGPAPEPNGGKPGSGQRATIDSSVYRQIAEQADSGRGAASADPGNAGARDARAIIGWIYLMCQPRCLHVIRYRDTIKASNARVDHAINLLVDFDRWLGDRPDQASKQSDQVAFWTRYASIAKREGSPITLHTFAGYDPLRHAGERLSGTRPYLETMLDWIRAEQAANQAASHRIRGFKLYPPMGFRASSNGDLDVSHGERGAREVRTWWTKQGWDIARVGREVDISLDQFFRASAELDVPLLAHAANSMASMEGAGVRASPRFWIERAKQVQGWGGNPLRVCLGHFRRSVENRALLVEILRLNKPASDGRPGAQIYVDMSYDDDILSGSANDVLDFFASACREANSQGEYVLFGSDWIMVGQDARAHAYLSNLRDAVANHCFWGSKSALLFRENMLKFLKLS
ncbi:MULTISPECIES: hypothetical protein [unclassified Sphingomonas]|uniref:hypothetical protein n=1 Tax=unclassified Sphingomonas TaxID=196159 RepID=UPI00215137D8|nr:MULTISPECIES: hypothetical protein [unclassified Sphingomonas]MCR5869473.1 hypothetical protein [Sphingomonas sp. J344]UUX98799.1 hypothetical protein LRS08_14935 [Sphingomonas sp. J315]